MPSDLFRLKSFRKSRVSEISETTAGANIAAEEGIHFHIGNPVWDQDLIHRFYHVISGQLHSDAALGDDDLFIRQAVADAVYYAPRGGYRQTSPSRLIRHFHQWLTTARPALNYDLGEHSARRELNILSGGMTEALRMLLSGLDHYLDITPALVWRYGTDSDLPYHFENIQLQNLPENDPAAILLLKNISAEIPQPRFLILHNEPGTVLMHYLKSIAPDGNLIIIEANGAVNSRSLAREAGYTERCLRFFTAGQIHADWTDSSLVFAAGSRELIHLLEVMHFQLKGTPAATELAHLQYRWTDTLQLKPTVHPTEFSTPLAPDDYFSGENYPAVIETFIANTASSSAVRQLEASFLSRWLGVHPHYSAADAIVVSGSARTALSLLGFQLGFRRVIFPDFSWNYEDVFPEGMAIPFSGDFRPDTDALIAAVTTDSHAALVINSPHNASGIIFTETEIRRILKTILPRKQFVIDDLSYDNVYPAASWRNLPTIRMTALDMVRRGELIRQDLNYLMTVHSLSKTDCFAGGRLCIAHLPHPDVQRRFRALSNTIQPQVLSLLLAYLFYRRGPDAVHAFYSQRNQIFANRMTALLRAVERTSPVDNPYQIRLHRPEGSMYPRLEISELPAGININALADRLAAQGIGLIPFSNFSRTLAGIPAGRHAFRLTLGGNEAAVSLELKMARLVEELTRSIRDEAREFRRYQLIAPAENIPETWPSWEKTWLPFRDGVLHHLPSLRSLKGKAGQNLKINSSEENDFRERYVPQRLKLFEQGLKDTAELLDHLEHGGSPESITHWLNHEFYKEAVTDRETRFRRRLFDRTVHPTQMFALAVSRFFDTLELRFLNMETVTARDANALGRLLALEYLGENVRLSSEDEADELVCDLRYVTRVEAWQRWAGHLDEPLLLSFWGDWDGSSRPPGQGHRLVAAALLETIRVQLRLIHQLRLTDTALPLPEDLELEIQRFPRREQAFLTLLNHITELTTQLGQRVESLSISGSNELQHLRRLSLRKDPMARLIAHNDRLERKMFRLRKQRHDELSRWFAFNKSLRKFIHDHIPELAKYSGTKALRQKLSISSNYLKHLALTPRIHQNILTSDDPFMIDTIVENLVEINAIGGRFGSPGLILALQVSMSDDPDALIALDRKLRAERERMLRRFPDTVLQNIGIVPLFEDEAAVNTIPRYLDQLWQYAGSDRRMEQSTAQRFSESFFELFIAGSDLSQQIGQGAGNVLYRQAVGHIQTWLAEHLLLTAVRIKLGSGEPAQRQSGYFDPAAGTAAFSMDADAGAFSVSVQDAICNAVSPLRGLMSSAEFRTIQSNAFEAMRQLPMTQSVNLWHHIRESQRIQRHRLRQTARQSGTRRTVPTNTPDSDSFFQHPVFRIFIDMHTAHFRQIIYGSPSDLAGIHLISYFVSRTTPSLRDRPAARPSREKGSSEFAIVERMTSVIPLSEHGTMLRAIGHNRSQTLILGINQLTTGLFRAFQQFISATGNEKTAFRQLTDIILPRLPVQDILHTLRIYQDRDLKILSRLVSAYPAGNSALAAVQEEARLLPGFIPLLQNELWRRHGIYPAQENFTSTQKQELLSLMRPDLAILLQDDLFNCDEQLLFGKNIRLNMFQADVLRQELTLPQQIRRHRDAIWELLHEPVTKQLRSFMNIAEAVAHLKRLNVPLLPDNRFDPKIQRSMQILLKRIYDKNFRDLLISSLQILGQQHNGQIGIPVRVARALKDIETIALIDKQALSPRQQYVLRYHILQAARLARENG